MITGSNFRALLAQTVGEEMSKQFAPDDPDEGRLEVEQDANRAASSQSQDPQATKLEDSMLARLYKTERIAERFVGRTEELTRLRDWFELSLTGQSKPAFIIGDPGIGKTELVRQFFSDIQPIDKFSLNGRYFDVASGAPYKVFLDGLNDLACNLERNIFQDDSPLNVGEVKSLQACLKEIREISSALLIQEPDGERIKYRTFDLLAQSYKMLTSVRPVVLFLDDLQWADELSLELLAYLIRAMKGDEGRALLYHLHGARTRDNARRESTAHLDEAHEPL
jgi:hypothetical protein